MMLAYHMALMCFYMVSMISMTPIPLAWLKPNVESCELEVDDTEKSLQVTELNNNVFKQLNHNVTTVILRTHVSYIEPHAFAGLEDINYLEFTG